MRAQEAFLPVAGAPGWSRCLPGRRVRLGPALLIAAGCLCGGPVAGQGPEAGASASWTLPAWLLEGTAASPTAANEEAGGWAQDPQFFRMPGSFDLAAAGIGMPLGGGRSNPLPAPFRQTVGPLQVAGGVEAGSFDFRLPGDVGGPGYYTLDSQLKVFNARTSTLALSLQTVTPVWQILGGRMAPPSLVSPSLAWFQEAGDRLALQAFVGTNIAPTFPTAPLDRSLQYGLGVATPLLGSPTSGRACFLFIEALGAQANTLTAGGPVSQAWQVIPGIHWRGGKDWWLSGGLLLPLDATDLAAPLWQITCSRHF
jgi:hypothetical protein